MRIVFAPQGLQNSASARRFNAGISPSRRRALQGRRRDRIYDTISDPVTTADLTSLQDELFYWIFPG
jgi:hypothetical protein